MIRLMVLPKIPNLNSPLTTFMELLEGDTCLNCNKGIFIYQIENCSCHINPPCPSCVNAKLECSYCGFTEGDEIEFFNENEFTM